MAALTATDMLQAAELPALHPAPNKPAETPAVSNDKGFEIPESGLHVSYGGYIEGAVTMSNLKGATVSSPISKRRNPAP